MSNIQQFKEARVKEFDKQFGALTSVFGVNSKPRVKSFLLESIDLAAGIALEAYKDELATWAECERREQQSASPADEIEEVDERAYCAALTSLLTFIGRNKE